MECKDCGKLARDESLNGLVASMENMTCNKVQAAARKVKKKQTNGELDRLKQAEKKKRRLEKALATSAAIRSELEKKKQEKKEEQQRLDEEGAAIAEAVALQVLLGEDSDDPCKLMINGKDGFNPWGSNIDLITERGAYHHHHHQHNGSSSLFQGIGWVSNNYGYGYKLGTHESTGWSFSYGPIEASLAGPYADDEGWDTAELSIGILAAQAVSSLQIAEDPHAA